MLWFIFQKLKQYGLFSVHKKHIYLDMLPEQFLKVD